MGTSVKMLEQHCSHFTVSDNPNKFAGHEKREDQERKQEQDESAVLIKQMASESREQKKNCGTIGSKSIVDGEVAGEGELNEEFVKNVQEWSLEI